MAKNFYTNCLNLGDKILYREIDKDGNRTSKRFDYYPTLFIRTDKQTKYKTIDGTYVDKVKPGSIKDTKDFLKRYEGIDNFCVYGNTQFQYCYLSDMFPGTVDYDLNKIRIAYLDIETGSDSGFPDPSTAREPVIAISVYIDGKFDVFGTGDYTPHKDNIVYHKCEDEMELLNEFVSFWSEDYPDILTGWNTTFFDIPYLVNRISNVLGGHQAKKLSPWNWFTQKQVNMMGRTQSQFTLSGISSLDYLDLYKKFAPNYSQESYRLDHIAHVELGERKLDYSEYGSLHNLYKQDYQKFIEYNIKDVELVRKLDMKLKLIELVVTLAYEAKINYEDVYSQVRMWDCLIFNELRKRNIVIPPKVETRKDSAYAGGYVKEPITGFHGWTVSYDLNSLYPKIIQGLNLSPETVVNRPPETITVDMLLERAKDLSYLKEKKICLAANGHHFRTDIDGFMGDIIKKMYDERVLAKKKMIEKQKELELIKQEMISRGMKL